MLTLLFSWGEKKVEKSKTLLYTEVEFTSFRSVGFTIATSVHYTQSLPTIRNGDKS